MDLQGIFLQSNLTEGIIVSAQNQRFASLACPSHSHRKWIATMKEMGQRFTNNPLPRSSRPTLTGLLTQATNSSSKNNDTKGNSKEKDDY